VPRKFSVMVSAGEHERTFCPVSIALPDGYEGVDSVDLADDASGAVIPSQVHKIAGVPTLTWLVDGLKAGASRKLVVSPAKASPCKGGVVLSDDRAEGKVDVLIGGRLFTSYHYGRQWVRPFLYPVKGPQGVQVTRNWPVVEGVAGEHTDHKHHKSIWVAYGECGKTKVDNWAEEEGHGWQRHRRFSALTSGPVFGRIAATNDWCTHAEKKQFEEAREICFYALPGGTRLFDITVTFRMTEGPITFYDTKEGGLVAVRVASSMDVRNGGRIENGYGGVNEAETWGKSAPWCDYSGVVEGRHVGIAIMDYETNPRYPTGWHVRDYGLMTANCFAWQHYRPEAKVRGDMTFAKGQRTAWRYRLYIHRGDARNGRVKDRFLDFVAPPKTALG